MRCPEALDRLLEVELPLSEGSELAEHVRGCATCRGALARVEEATALLDAWLAETPALDVESIVACTRGPDVTKRRPVLTWAVPLAAVAAAAGIAFLLPHNDPSDTPAEVEPAPRTTVSADPGSSPGDLELSVPPGLDAAVFTTRDPSITVIWFYQGD